MDCLKILQVEDGTLHVMVVALLEATRGFQVPAGSVVVLSSVSHLAWVGTAAWPSSWGLAKGSWPPFGRP
jgi:hypothetical protein